MQTKRLTLGLILGMLSATVWAQSNPGKAPMTGETSTLRPAGFKPVYRMSESAVKRGKQLFNDASLSTNGRTCGSCHEDAQSFGPRFRTPYPHAAMNSKARFGVDTLQLDEVVQVCVQGPLRGAPLEWGSPEQVDLTTYLLKVQATGKM